MNVDFFSNKQNSSKTNIVNKMAVDTKEISQKPKVQNTQLSQHRLATEASPKYRPFFNTTLVSYMAKLIQEGEENPEGNFTLMLDAATKLVRRAELLGINAATGSHAAYLDRITKVAEKTKSTKQYTVGLRLLFREAMRLMCAARAPDLMPQVTRISDPNEAADLLYQSFRAMISNTTEEAKILENLKVVISIGCGSWGEVFMEKHSGNDVNMYLYTGLYADLFCSFVNKYVVDAADKVEADSMLAALLELTSIHPCADQCSVFQAEKISDVELDEE